MTLAGYVVMFIALVLNLVLWLWVFDRKEVAEIPAPAAISFEMKEEVAEAKRWLKNTEDRFRWPNGEAPTYVDDRVQLHNYANQTIHILSPGVWFNECSFSNCKFEGIGGRFVSCRFYKTEPPIAAGIFYSYVNMETY